MKLIIQDICILKFLHYGAFGGGLVITVFIKSTGGGKKGKSPMKNKTSEETLYSILEQLYWDYSSEGSTKAEAKAHSAIAEAIRGIIGEDEQWEHMRECSNPENCLFCRFVNGGNQVRAIQRNRLKAFLGEEHE